MKKKYRAIQDLGPSTEFSKFLIGSSEPAFSELVNLFPPDEVAETGNKGKRANQPGFCRPKRRILVESQLDLHGMTAAEAEKKTASYLLTQKQRGRRTIRIIPGKGLHSIGSGVLRDVVEEVLIEAKENGIILDYRWDRERKEKSGAVLVFLN